jgi:hypothetical protein
MSELLYLFVAEGDDGVELSGFASGPDTEKETDGDGNDDARDGSPGGDGGG